MAEKTIIKIRAVIRKIKTATIRTVRVMTVKRIKTAPPLRPRTKNR